MNYPSTGAESIHLSIVAVSRNDDHGGDMRGRMQLFVDGFIAQCRRHGLVAELILVEWNPPPDRPPLEDALRWPDEFGPATVRVVTVPPEVHAEFPHSSTLPLFQMIGKNVGIRRARGRYVLATNVDILFDDAMVRYLRDRLRSGIMLRADRYDVPSDLTRGVPFEQTIAESKMRCFQVNVRYGIFDVERRRIINLGDNFEACLLAAYVSARIFGISDLAERSRRRIPPAISRAKGTFSRAVVARSAAAAAFLKSVAPAALLVLSSLPSLSRRLFLNIRPLKSMPIRAYWFGRRNLRRVANVARRFLRFAGAKLQASFRKVYSAVARTRIVLAKVRPLIGPFARLQSPADIRMARSHRLHTNGCGDFTLLAREDWFRLRGYPEWAIFSWHIDSVFMFAANANDIREIALGPKYRIYHIDHSLGSGWSPAGARKLFERLDSNGIPYLDNKAVRDLQEKFADDPRCAITNAGNWGLADRGLSERQVLPGAANPQAFMEAGIVRQYDQFETTTYSEPVAAIRGQQ